MDIDAYPRYLDLSLDRIKALLVKLGSPEKNLKNIIHIAGTNGKGSTQAILASILNEAGHRVHCFTSPHLIKINERITLAGEPISDEKLAYYEELVTQHIPDKNKIGFFEVITAMAFCAFQDHPYDYIILETGLGGRFDATNVIENPALTLITKIGIDHEKLLGNTLVKIAAEKAGIIKKNTPLVTLQQAPEVMTVFKERAKSLNAPFYIADIDFPFTYNPLYLKADYQKENAALAVKAAQLFAVKENTVLEYGVNKAFTRGRMQMIRAENGLRIWVDGAHNVDGAKTLSYEMAKWQKEDPNCKICMSVALLKNRDPQDYFSALYEVAKPDYIAILKDLAGLDKDRFHDFDNTIFECQEYDTLQALMKSCQEKRMTDLIFTGSLYYIGHILDLSQKGLI